MIRAFVFDLDGTLVETEQLKALSYARAATALRPDLNEGEVIAAFGDLVGLSRQEVAVGLMRRFGLEEAARARMAEFGVDKPWQAYVQIRLGIYEEMLGDPKERRSLDTEMRFENKVVLITGGGGGIGKAAARRFLEEGAKGVVLGSRRQQVLEAAKEELDPSGQRVELFAGDASKRETAKAFVAAATQRFGGVDVLVNSTGIFRVKPFEEETEDDFEEALDSTLRPAFYVSQAAVPEMRRRGGGAIVNVGSMWAIDAIATTPTSAYSAAQAGRHALTKNLAIELAKDNIRVNTVALAFVETPAYERFMAPEEARAVLDSVNTFHPLGRHGQPEDVVEAILFLASVEAGWITGTTLPIDGGVLAGRSPAAA
jgi:NAD(P)-dependent dehydrogenase (short-subunit alcohol dehydrogenase family)